MRVIAGSAGGRRLKAPPGRATRPTSDRVKEALFSSLQPHLHGAVVLDLYAGSGGLGIEALSRGAASATFVEIAPRTVDVLRDNLRTTGFEDRADVVTSQVLPFLRRPPLNPAALATVAFLDPPYDLTEDGLAEVLAALVDQLDPAGAVVVVERGSKSAAPTWPADLHAVRSRAYGSTSLHVAELLPPDEPTPGQDA